MDNMDYDERLTALKKAYADMILNTGKEAAARVMVADRRTQRLQHELNSSKEQALQMMLRLKQMMDFKVKEAGVAYFNQQQMIEELKAQLRGAEDRIIEVETACLSQQRKIEVLEAQLGEAEDIVTDLREELRKERTERNSAGNSKLQLMGEHEKKLATSTQDPPPQEKKLDTSPALVISPELPVVSLTPKKPCQQNTNSVPPPESQLEKLAPSIVRSSSVNPSVEIKTPSLPSVVLGNKEPEPFRNRRTQRIRAFEEKLMAGELAFVETTDAVTYHTNRREDRKRKSSEKRDAVQPKRSSPSEHTTLRSFRKKIKKSRKLSNRKNALSDGKPSRLSEYISEKGTVNKCTEEARDVFGLDSARDKDKSSSMDSFSVKGHGIQSPDNSELPICEMDDGKADAPTETSLLVNTSNDVPVMTSNGKVIKYTFQRKRKREALSNSEGNTSLEQDSSKKDAVDEQNSPTVMEKCSNLKGSSRDNKGLAVAAHQLISLSEKKW